MSCHQVTAPLALRYSTGGPRWMSLNSVLWNCEGMFIAQKPPHAQARSCALRLQFAAAWERRGAVGCVAAS
jgi:hypothetical protein